MSRGKTAPGWGWMKLKRREVSGGIGTLMNTERQNRCQKTQKQVRGLGKNKSRLAREKNQWLSRPKQKQDLGGSKASKRAGKGIRPPSIVKKAAGS